MTTLREKFSLFDWILCWFAGYSGKEVSPYSGSERAALHPIGSVVTFVAGFTTVNWTVSGYIYSNDLSIAILVGLLGFVVVSMFDRGFLRALDLRSGQQSRFAVFTYGVGRVLVSFIFGSITAMAIMPYLMKDELAGHGLEMVEEGERKRLEELESRYKVPEKTAALKTVNSDVRRLEMAAKQLPNSIMRQLKSMEVCWKTYRERLTALNAIAATPGMIAETLQPISSRCLKLQNSAKKAENAYWATTRVQLQQARVVKLTTAKEVLDATSTVKSRVEKARTIEERAFTINSAVVFKDLIDTKPAARIKWSMLSALIMLIELSPLLLKGLLGQTTIGYRIASWKASTIRTLSIKAQQETMELENTTFLVDLNRIANQAGLQSPDVQAKFLNAVIFHVSALAPLEGVHALLKEIETRHIDIDGFIARFPKYAEVITEAWARAMRDVKVQLRQNNFAGAPA